MMAGILRTTELIASRTFLALLLSSIGGYNSCKISKRPRKNSMQYSLINCVSSIFFFTSYFILCYTILIVSKVNSSSLSSVFELRESGDNIYFSKRKKTYPF